jgi:hypothetical protein
MGPVDFLVHLLNFAAPAAFVALVLALGGRLVSRPSGRQPRWWVLALVNLAVGCSVLAGGLVFFGRDGKMLTYAALVLACASCHWLAVRAWRR